MTRAIESFAARRDIPVFIPAYEVTAEIGFSAESVRERYNGFGAIAEALRSGKIRGIVNMVGCNNPRVVYERAIVDIAEELIKNDVLIFTNGCALVFHGDFAEEHTELARAAVRAYLDASEHLTEHPEEQTKIAGHFLKTQPDVLAASFDYISYESPILSRAVYDDLTYRMKAEGLIARIPSYEEFVDERLLP